MNPSPVHIFDGSLCTFSCRPARGIVNGTSQTGVKIRVGTSKANVFDLDQ